jgi:hypothetical protein
MVSPWAARDRGYLVQFVSASDMATEEFTEFLLAATAQNLRMLAKLVHVPLSQIAAAV